MATNQVFWQRCILYGIYGNIPWFSDRFYILNLNCLLIVLQSDNTWQRCTSQRQSFHFIFKRRLATPHFNVTTISLL